MNDSDLKDLAHQMAEAFNGLLGPCVRTFPPFAPEPPDYRDAIIEEQRTRIVQLEDELAVERAKTDVPATAAKIEEVRLACLSAWARGYNCAVADLSDMPLPNRQTEHQRDGIRRASLRSRRLATKGNKLAEARDVGALAKTVKCRHSQTLCYNQSVHPGLVHRECWAAYAEARMTGAIRNA